MYKLTGLDGAASDQDINNAETAELPRLFLQNRRSAAKFLKRATILKKSGRARNG